MLEVIDKRSLIKYTPLLTEDELYRISDGLYSALGIYDTAGSAPISVLVTEILPSDIRIRKLTTAPSYRGRGYATRLLSFVIEKSQGLPVTVYDPPEEGWLLSQGFTKKPTDYSLCETRLGDIKRLPFSKESRTHYSICDIAEAPQASLKRYVMSHPVSEDLSFPDYDITSDRFSECSLAALSGDRVCGAILYEEIDNTILIRYYSAEDPGILNMLFSAFKTRLEMDYYNRTKLYFLSSRGMAVPTDILQRYDHRSIVLYRKE